MKNSCLDLRDHETKIMSYEKNEMIPLTNEERKIHGRQKNVTYAKKDLVQMMMIKNHCHYTGKYREPAHDICNLRNKAPKELSVPFHNCSTYDSHFKIKELSKESEGQFECLRENTEKYITFLVLLIKNLKMVNQFNTK